jgi:transketolase
MTIVAPADANEMRRLMPLTVDHDGPMYIRLAKGYDPIVTTDAVPFAIGKAIPMREGRDALIVTTGITLKLALQAATELAATGVDCAVLHMPTVKPFDIGALLERAKETPIIVAVEENVMIGGLGSAVAEAIAEADFESPKRFRRIGIPDVFADHYGSQAQLMDHYRISAAEIVSTVTRLSSAVV